MTSLRSTLSVLLILLSTSSAAIDYSASGFLSLSAVKLDEKGYSLSGIDHTLSFDNDTILGGQLSAEFTSSLSVTGQVVARGFALDNSTNYQPTLDWLYLTYDVTPELRVRLGRLATPFYSVSEYFEIGAAYPWVRPPLDVYEPAMSPIKNFNGVSVVLRTNWNDWYVLSQLFTGQEENKTAVYDINIHRVSGLNFSFSKHYFSLRIASILANVSLDIFDTQETLTTLRGLPAAFALDEVNNAEEISAINSIIEIFESNRIKHQYSSIGLEWDNETWFIYSEYNRLASEEGFTPDGEGAYITIGYRFDNFTPYFTRGDIRSLLGQELKDMAVKELLTSESAILNTIGGEVLEVTSTNRRYQRSYALGLRYDFSDAMSLKIEAQKVNSERNTTGLFSSKDEAIIQAPEINVYSIVLDMVF